MILAAPIHFVEVKTSTSTDLHESELYSEFQWIEINSLRFAGFPIFMGQGEAGLVRFPNPIDFQVRQGKVFFFAGRTSLNQWLFDISFWQSLIPNVINMTEHKCQYFNVYWMQLLSKIRNCSLPKDDIDISVDVTWWRYWSIGNFLLCFSIGCFSWIFLNFGFQGIFFRKEGNAEVLEGAFRRSGLRRIRSNWFKKANRSDASPMKWCSVVLHWLHWYYRNDPGRLVLGWV